jgi:hypothetical protein
MKIKLKISPDHIMQIREDLAYAAVSMKSGGKEALQSYTLDILRRIVKKAEKKSVETEAENSAFAGAFAEPREEETDGKTF